MEELTDEILMEKVMNGNLEMMRPLFQRYHIKIYNFCYHMTGNGDLSKDLTQEVFYRIIKHSETYNHNKFSPWIYAIARNLCKDTYKNQHKTQQLIDYSRFDLEKFPLQKTTDKGCIKQLNIALGELDVEDRELIIMGKYQGLKYHEIAAIIKTTSGATKTRMHRAMNKLRQAYFSLNIHHDL